MAGIPRCPAFDFVPRIVHRNTTSLDPRTFGIDVPEGVAPEHVREPTFVSAGRMQTLLRSQTSGRGGLGVVHGLTRAEFSLRFSDFERQWHRDRRGDLATWTFQGGDVYLQVTLEVFVLEGDRPDPSDAASRRIFGIIAEHELEHVADEIDIVRRWMPPKVRRDRVARRYLSDAQPLQDRTFRHWFRSDGFERWLRNGLWAREHNRRQAQRDSPEEYRRLQERIDRERIRQVNE